MHPSTLQPYLLCVARYSPEKNLPFLINVYRKSTLYKEWKLVLIGDGPEREALVKLVGDETDYIKLTGWKSYNELPGWYTHANIFVLPSLFEPWGLVVNEAMAAGLPVIVSNACGCVPELVHPGNGFTFEPDNESALINIFDKIITMNSAEREGLRESSRDIIRKFSPVTWSSSFSELSGIHA